MGKRFVELYLKPPQPQEGGKGKATVSAQALFEGCAVFCERIGREKAKTRVFCIFSPEAKLGGWVDSP